METTDKNRPAAFKSDSRAWFEAGVGFSVENEPEVFYAKLNEGTSTFTIYDVNNCVNYANATAYDSYFEAYTIFFGQLVKAQIRYTECNFIPDNPEDCNY